MTTNRLYLNRFARESVNQATKHFEPAPGMLTRIQVLCMGKRENELGSNVARLKERKPRLG